MNIRELAPVVEQLMRGWYEHALRLRAIDYAHRLSDQTRLTNDSAFGSIAKRNAAYVKAFMHEMKNGDTT